VGDCACRDDGAGHVACIDEVPNRVQRPRLDLVYSSGAGVDETAHYRPCEGAFVHPPAKHVENPQHGRFDPAGRGRSHDQLGSAELTDAVGADRSGAGRFGYGLDPDPWSVLSSGTDVHKSRRYSGRIEIAEQTRRGEDVGLNQLRDGSGGHADAVHDDMRSEPAKMRGQAAWVLQQVHGQPVIRGLNLESRRRLPPAGSHHVKSRKRAGRLGDTAADEAAGTEDEQDGHSVVRQQPVAQRGELGVGPVVVLGTTDVQPISFERI